MSNNIYLMYPNYRVQPRYARNVDSDDCLQLQYLLQQERKRRTEEENRRQEQHQLELALTRLYYLQRFQEQQRLEEERRRRREQRYRTELMLALKAAEEEQYRRRILAALERQKQWESIRIKREENQRKQREGTFPKDEQKRAELEHLLKHVFGLHSGEVEEHESDEEVPELSEDDGTVWQRYYHPAPRQVRTAPKVPPAVITGANNRQARPELKERTIPLQPLLENLLAQSTHQNLQQNQESAARHQVFDNILKDAADSAEARHKHHNRPLQQKQQQQQQQQQQSSAALSTPINIQTDKKKTDESTKPKVLTEPTIPLLTEEERAISQVTHQLETMNDISAKLDKIQDECENDVLKDTLTFADLKANTNLSATSTGSRHWLKCEDEIMRILVQLDTIESNGSDLVRERRKELVKKASALLDRLDEHKHSEFERASLSGDESDLGVSDIEVVEKDESQEIEPNTANDDIKPKPTAANNDIEPTLSKIEPGRESSNIGDSNVGENETTLSQTQPQEIKPNSTPRESNPEIESETVLSNASELDLENQKHTEPEFEKISVPLPTSGHPHPENPNATTVDEVLDEDSSKDETMKATEEEDFVVV